MIYYYGKVSVPRKEILMEKEDVATNNEKEDDASETQDVDLKDENGLDEEEKKVVDKAKELDGEVSKKQKKNNKKPKNIDRQDDFINIIDKDDEEHFKARNI